MNLGGIALAAGAGTRLRPLTELRPKALCPVGGRPLLDLALDRLAPVTGDGSDHLAVNAHHLADQIRNHVSRLGTDETRPGGVHLQLEVGEALGTAGAVAGLLPWLDGRPALVTNADSYLPGGLGDLLPGWDGERCRLLCTVTTGRADFVGADGRGLRYVGACLLPWQRIRRLAAVPSGLYEVLWRDDLAAGALDLVVATQPAATTAEPGSAEPGSAEPATSAVAIDCGTPADYLTANLHASSGASVVGAGATVLGQLVRSVVWDGAWVGPDEVLVESIRAGDRDHPLTVAARLPNS